MKKNGQNLKYQFLVKYLTTFHKLQIGTTMYDSNFGSLQIAVSKIK